MYQNNIFEGSDLDNDIRRLGEVILGSNLLGPIQGKLFFIYHIKNLA